jgi:hypothetical protein
MPERVRATVKNLWARYWYAVDSQHVVIFQFIFGTMFILAGINGIFAAHAEPPMTLHGSMDALDVRIWYWLLIVGPLSSLTGKCMRGSLTYAGTWMELTGDVTISLALLAYITGTVQVESWGKGGFGAFLGAGFCIAAAVTVTRDVRELLRVERAK